MALQPPPLLLMSGIAVLVVLHLETGVAILESLVSMIAVLLLQVISVFLPTLASVEMVVTLESDLKEPASTATKVRDHRRRL